MIRRKTHCKRGHERTPDRINKHNSCKTCDSLRKCKIYAANPEAHRAAVRNWAQTNKDKAKEKDRRRRALENGAPGSFTEQDWHNLCILYGNACLCCGKPKQLEPDHVVPLFKGGTDFLWNIQPLCKTCNASKGTKSTDYRKTWSRGLPEKTT